VEVVSSVVKPTDWPLDAKWMWLQFATVEDAIAAYRRRYKRKPKWVMLNPNALSRYMGEKPTSEVMWKYAVIDGIKVGWLHNIPTGSIWVGPVED
jgi:hypothetical protein